MNEPARGMTMTVREIAEAMGVPRETVRNAIARVEGNGQNRPLGIRARGAHGGKPRRKFREMDWLARRRAVRELELFGEVTHDH